VFSVQNHVCVIVHYEFIAQGQTVNQQCYLEVLTRLWESVRRKRPGLWPETSVIHHENAPGRDALRHFVDVTGPPAGRMVQLSRSSTESHATTFSRNRTSYGQVWQNDGLRARRPGTIDSSLHHSVQTGSVGLSNWSRGSFPFVKRPECDGVMHNRLSAGETLLFTLTLSVSLL
jgi:hypothetical protein